MNETYSIDLPDFVFEASEEKRVKSTIMGRVISIEKCEGDYVCLLYTSDAADEL